MFSRSLFPAKVDKDLEQCIGITTETEEKAFLDEKGGEIQCALGRPKCFEHMAQSQAPI